MNNNINLLNTEDFERLREIVDVTKRLKKLSLSLRRYYGEISLLNMKEEKLDTVYYYTYSSFKPF